MISPASGQPRQACPATVAARASSSAVKWTRRLLASRCVSSSQRASASRSITALLSVPRLIGQPAAARARAGPIPSARSASVVGHRQHEVCVAPSTSMSSRSRWVACTTVLRGPSTPASFSTWAGVRP